MTRRRRWLLRALAAVLFLAAASECLSLSLRTRRAHRFLTSRLEAAFGRPVEVGHFAFSLFDGPRIEAEPVTVAEDPHFGQEYFVRAEQMAAGLRWGRLLHGYFEFGTLSFTHPSLNLVRASDGRWNIENWLPPPSSALPQKSFPAQEGNTARLYKIAVDGGRINFMRGVDKQAFALVDVRGTVEQETLGRWRLDLAAQPMRSGAVLQEAGTLRVRGSIAGTSARLQPADLYLTWEDASLADVLRLARGKDYGVRGRLALEVTASSHRPNGLGWSFSLSARGSQFHRWDMTELPADPGLNVKAEARWVPGEARMELSSVMIEAPHSQIRGTGQVVWPAGIRPDVDFQSAEVSFADLLDWFRAFHPGVAEGLAADGTIRASFAAKDWPLHLEHAELSSSGAAVRIPGLTEAIHLGEISAELRHDLLKLDAVLIQLPRAANPGQTKVTAIVQERKAKKGKTKNLAASDQLEVTANLSLRGRSAQLALDGTASRAEDLLAVTAAFGRAANPRWKLEGSAELHLRWQLGFFPWTAAMAGSTDLKGTRLWMTGLNFPVEISGAHIEWGEGGRRATLTGAKAMGARWQGTLAQLKTGSSDILGAWQFKLSADRITAANLDHWLGPRARPGFFDRLFPSAASSASASQSETSGESSLQNLQASGQIAVEDLVVEPLQLHKMKASVDLESRTLRLYDVQSEFQAGKLSGVFEARLGPQPEYRADANFDRANLALLAAPTARLKDHVGGMASGEIHLTARGIGREALVKSLEGRGAATIHNALFRGIDLRAALAQGSFRPGTTQSPSAETAFTISGGNIEVRQLRLDNGGNIVEAEGTIQFSHAWDLRIHSLGSSKDKRRSATDTREVRLTGSLEAPQVIPLEANAGPR